MNIFIRIKGMTEISKTMQGISSYILKQPKEVIDMTISQLSQACYVSSATIVRYTKELGFQGYKEFKVELATDLDEYLTWENIQYDELLNQEPELSFGNVKDYYYNLASISLKNQYKHLKEPAIEEMVKGILKADSVRVWGVGSSLLAAKDFAYRLRKVGILASCETIIGYDDTAFQLNKAKEINIIISQSLENTQVLQWMNNFSSNKKNFSLITSNHESEFIRKAENTIIYGDYDLNLRMSDPFMNRTALYFVLDVIIGLVYSRQYHYSMKSITEYRIAVRKEKDRFNQSNNKNLD